MRFEAKHSYFKQLSHSMGNFINITFSLAMRHQQYQCYLNMNTSDLFQWSDCIEVGKGNIKNWKILKALIFNDLWNKISTVVLLQCL